MALSPFAFDPVNGLRDSTEYPDPATEAEARAQVQEPSDQIKDYINGTIIPGIERVTFVSVVASKTLAASDANTMQECNHATVAIVNTIPPNSSVAFPDGTQIAFSRDGDADVSVALGSGVTITNTTKLKIANKGESMVLVKKGTGTDTWKLYGSLKA